MLEILRRFAPQNDMKRELVIGDNPLLPRHADGGVAGFDAELIVDRAQVGIHRAAADDKLLCDLRVAEVLREQAEHLDFARCQGFGGG